MAAGKLSRPAGRTKVRTGRPMEVSPQLPDSSPAGNRSRVFISSPHRYLWLVHLSVCCDDYYRRYMTGVIRVESMDGRRKKKRSDIFQTKIPGRGRKIWFHRNTPALWHPVDVVPFVSCKQEDHNRPIDLKRRIFRFLRSVLNFKYAAVF